MKVLIAVDSSEIAERAFDWYIENLHRPDNVVIVFHTTEPPKLPTFSFTEVGSFPSSEITKIMTEKNKATNDLESKYTMKCGSQVKKTFVAKAIEGGNPGELVVKYCKDEGVGHIIMGSRGLGTVRRTILGSVSDYIVHHIKVPVTIVPKA